MIIKAIVGYVLSMILAVLTISLIGILVVLAAKYITISVFLGVILGSFFCEFYWNILKKKMNIQ